MPTIRSINVTKNNIDKFSIYEDMQLPAPYGTYSFEGIKINRVASVSLSLQGLIYINDDMPDVFNETDGYLSFLDPEGNEVCTIDVSGLELFAMKWVERINNILAIDLMDKARANIIEGS